MANPSGLSHVLSLSLSTATSQSHARLSMRPHRTQLLSAALDPIPTKPLSSLSLSLSDHRSPIKQQHNSLSLSLLSLSSPLALSLFLADRICAWLARSNATDRDAFGDSVWFRFGSDSEGLGSEFRRERDIERKRERGCIGFLGLTLLRSRVFLVSLFFFFGSVPGVASDMELRALRLVARSPSAI